MSYAIRLKNISKRFTEPKEHALMALEDISLDVMPGEFFVFVGPSGSGKSTLLRIMSGLEKSYKGQIEFGEGFSTKGIGFIFQQFALLPWLSVLENVEINLIGQKFDKNKIRHKAMGELEKLGLDKFANSYPRDLSGGMRQRVGIARALVADPKILFMDEPFSELDSFTARELRKEVVSIWHERRPTIVMVTHIVEDALELADRIAVLTPSPGKLESIVENNLPHPRQKRSEEFFNLEDRIYKLIRP